jgi:hypothetical protein
MDVKCLPQKADEQARRDVFMAIESYRTAAGSQALDIEHWLTRPRAPQTHGMGGAPDRSATPQRSQ